jgi:hypothetical protein
MLFLPLLMLIVLIHLFLIALHILYHQCFLANVLKQNHSNVIYVCFSLNNYFSDLFSFFFNYTNGLRDRI